MFIHVVFMYVSLIGHFRYIYCDYWKIWIIISFKPPDPQPRLWLLDVPPQAHFLQKSYFLTPRSSLQLLWVPFTLGCLFLTGESFLATCLVYCETAIIAVYHVHNLVAATGEPPGASSHS